MNFNFSKRGQVAIYVIIALVIVGLIIGFFAFRGVLFKAVPTELEPVFSYYQECIAEETRAAIDLAETQAGHVDPGEYIPGSDYAPFSSQLNFLGFPVPYWYYITGNGVIKENVPTKTQIESEIENYIEEKLNENCNFDSFYEKGFDLEIGEPTAKVSISDEQVSVDVDSTLVAYKEEASATKSIHSAEVQSKLGKLYNTAKSIYEEEQKIAFLENYSVDTLVLYAPVDGVEISCSGRVWKTREVIEEFKNGLEANIGAIKLEGDYYSISKEENNYFVVNFPVENAVNFVYSKDWPTKIEIFGANDELMIAEPVGTQEGLGIMGFCYAPYHFVYDVNYPVMIQVFEGNEMFQFPMIVVINKNMPRKAIFSKLAAEEEEIDICQFDTQDIEINVYDTELNKIDANLSYVCFSQKCNLGSTSDGFFSGKAPACLNGQLIASAGGYAENKQLFSTNEERSADVILDREYEVNLGLEVGGKPLDGTAIIVFEGSKKTVSTALPDAETVKLSEGLYNITVYAYGNSSIVIPGSTKEQCVETARNGLLGFLGTTEEKCYDISIPETKIEYALIGGGRSEIYLLPSDLREGKLTLQTDSMPAPSSIEELQNNYEAFEGMEVWIEV